MNRAARVAVCSRSFSKNPTLRAELLERYELVTFNDEGRSLSGDSLVEFLQGHHKAITALERIDDDVVSRLPDLKVLSKYGVGLDSVDVHALRRHGVRLGWRGGVNRRSVSELVLAFAISMLRHVPAANREVLSGTWRQHTGGLLSGRTVGIIGCGHVGRDVVRLLQPFGCRLLVHDIRRYDAFYAKYGIEAVELRRLLSESDVITLHVPLDGSTRGLLGEHAFNAMKPSAILINTARGQLVDEAVLKTRLAAGQLAAAAFDVFAVEPPQDPELLNAPNFLATPHIGGSAAEAILAMGRAAIDGLDFNDVPGAGGLESHDKEEEE
jgi:phosphoglycerate dehydrogenase-like enzyme